MEKIKRSPKSKRGSDFFLKILSLILAIVVWFVLSITQYPTITKTISKVPVTLSLDGTVAKQKGLSAINYKDVQVDVEIQGMNYEIGSYTSNDLVATVNLNKVTSEGTYELDINVKSSHTTDKCTIVSVTPQTVTVDFDRVATKSLPLEIEAPLIRAEEGYTLRDASNTVSPDEITITGAKNDIDNVDKAVAKISKSQVISKDTTFTTEDIVFYDADDNVVESSKIDIQGDKNFDVSFRVYKKKTANLKVNITDRPDNFDADSLPMVQDETQIPIISPNLNSDDTETIEVGSISLSDIDLTNNESFDIVLGDGEINLNGAGKVSVTFDSKGYTSKSFTITKNRINTVNAPKGLTVSLETSKLTNVTIYGPNDVISDLTASDIYARVDLSDITEKGSYTRKALVYIPKYDNVWCYGTNEVQVKVSK